MIHGYARVSTESQRDALENQVVVLTDMGVDLAHIVQEVGSTRSPLPLRDALIESTQAGDEIVVYKLDRIGRSRRDVFEVFDILDKRKVTLRTHDGLLIDPTTAVGRLVRDLLVAIAQFERDNTHERMMEGVSRAKRQGKYQGRARALRGVTSTTIKALVEAEGVTGAADVLDVSRWTIQREIQRRKIQLDTDTNTDCDP